MVKIHSNRAFLGNIAVVVFLAFLITLTIGTTSYQAQAAPTLTEDSDLKWEGESIDDPDAVVKDKNKVWQEDSAQIVTKSSTAVTFDIQVLTDDFSNMVFRIEKGGTFVTEFGPDDLSNTVFNDVYGSDLQVFQISYDWVNAAGLDLTNNYTLLVYSGTQIASITLDLEGKPPSGGGGGGSSPTPVVPEPVLPEPEPEVAMPVPGDVAGHWAEGAIKALIAKNAMNGYPDGTFKPENLISRAEFATIVVKAFQLEAKGSKVFNDTASHWGREYIQTAYAHGIILGYNDSRFGPDDLITREQMAAMIIRVVELEKPLGGLTFTDSWKISDWAKEAVHISAKHQIINGYPDNTFRPADNAKRSEAATVIVNALNK